MPIIRSRRANAHILYDADRLCGVAGKPGDTPSEGIDPALFEPRFWEQRKAVVARAPGRGESLFVEPGKLAATADEQWVLRPYRRGGAVARVSEKRYLWRGAERSRAFLELRLTARLHAEGLSVPPPVGACVWRFGLGYEAALLSVRIPGAQALAARLEGIDRSTLEAVGALIRQAHARGLDHVDLNARNLLIDPEGRPWLIDLDRCRLRPPGRWRETNLARLERSLAKFAPGREHEMITAIRDGYAAPV